MIDQGALKPTLKYVGLWLVQIALIGAFFFLSTQVVTYLNVQGHPLLILIMVIAINLIVFAIPSFFLNRLMRQYIKEIRAS